MPQLDKVTLFSQVFWLVLLYFIFFLVFLKFYLPVFGNLFKIRLYYLNSAKGSSLGEFSITSLGSSSSTEYLTLWSKIDLGLQQRVKVFSSYWQDVLIAYNVRFLQSLNKKFVSLYVFSCLKYTLYKKFYTLKKNDL